MDHVGGIVVEGRDIGTVVSPDAPLKVYLTASADARAARRTKQDNAAGPVSHVDATLADVERRDRLDSSRAVSPLTPPPTRWCSTPPTSTSRVLDQSRPLLELVAREGCG